MLQVPRPGAGKELGSCWGQILPRISVKPRVHEWAFECTGKVPLHPQHLGPLAPRLGMVAWGHLQGDTVDCESSVSSWGSLGAAPWGQSWFVDVGSDQRHWGWGGVAPLALCCSRECGKVPVALAMTERGESATAPSGRETETEPPSGLPTAGLLGGAGWGLRIAVGQRAVGIPG